MKLGKDSRSVMVGRLAMAEELLHKHGLKFEVVGLSLAHFAFRLPKQRASTKGVVEDFWNKWQDVQAVTVNGCSHDEKLLAVHFLPEIELHGLPFGGGSKD